MNDSKNNKYEWIFYGRYGNEEWDSDYFGSQSTGEGDLMTEQEATELAKRMALTSFEWNDDDEKGEFEWKIEIFKN